MPKVIGIYIGLVLTLIFLLLHIPFRKRPVFDSIAVLMLACAGVSMAFDCGYITLTASEGDLGVLADYRFPMILGVLAWLFLSVTKIWETFYQLLTYKQREENHER
jgi:hypothetical protein